MEGKAGPQSQLKEACIFRMKLAWHSPFRYREIPFDKEEVIRDRVSRTCAIICAAICALSLGFKSLDTFAALKAPKGKRETKSHEPDPQRKF